MNNLKGYRYLVGTGLFLSLLFLLSTSPALAQTKKFYLKFGATSVRSGLYANTVAMAGIINKAYPAEIVVTVVETGGYTENLERLRRNTIHAGPASSGAGAASYLGILDWEGKPDRNLRILWGGYFTPIHLVASKKSGITAVEGFTGKPFAANPGTTSGWHMEYFLKAIGVKPDYKLMGLGASPDAMKSGVVDGWFKAGFKDAAILDIESAMDINVISLKPEHFARADKEQPGIHRSMTIPADLFKAVKTDQLSYAYVITDFVIKDIPEDVVYKMVKAVWEHRAALVGSMTTLKEGKFDDMVVNAAKFGIKVPFHAGAVKYFREIGQTIPPELIPPEAKR
ncbi:MAG: TAXI family TRAP transporter solute-binding subunit [Smithellaceae bacterium]|nr:TAXI family TRAP transporter solute-binding subunit [Smithellaceae bacterium]